MFFFNFNRWSAAVSRSPFPESNHKLFVSGGYIFDTNETLTNTAEILTEDGWQFVTPSVPVGIAEHCMALINSTAAIVIGGRQGSSFQTVNSYIFNSVGQEWHEGPPLKKARSSPVCGQIRSNDHSLGTSVIVIGGYNLTSTEVLDDGASEWKYGPELPIGIDYAALVEDHSNGIYLIGGRSAIGDQLDSIFYLSHAESEWQELPQKLPTGRYHHTAFFVPDEVANCQ
jgi:hypothetical protein